jgi:hypothetical protein
MRENGGEADITFVPLGSLRRLWFILVTDDENQLVARLPEVGYPHPGLDLEILPALLIYFYRSSAASWQTHARIVISVYWLAGSCASSFT